MRNGGYRKTVLVIDDEAVVGHVIKRMIEKNGYDAAVCRTSLDALAAAELSPPALIISDFNLPCYSNGVDLCLAIRQQARRDIPVIIISGQAENEKKARARGFEFLRKPLDNHALLPLVDAHLRGPAAPEKPSLPRLASPPALAQDTFGLK